MKRITPLIIVLLAIALTWVSCAVGSVRFQTRGLQVKMVPMDPNGISKQTYALAECHVLANQRRNAILHWSATPFRHVETGEVSSDALISAAVAHIQGPVVVTPRKAHDQSHLAAGDDDASIAMQVHGNGHARIRFKVALDDPFAAAGEHCAMVTLTVTGQ